jgi:hypothetical protein
MEIMQRIVKFPSRWLNAGQFETALRSSVGPHDPEVLDVVISIPSRCKIMVDAAIRLLSLANQLALTMRRVRLHFGEGESGTMGYLNRMGFIDQLARDVEVLPGRPVFSGANLHRGGNVRLVEIARINKDFRDDSLPTRLTDALMAAAEHSQHRGELSGAAWTVFAELIDNALGR